jgi:3-hydroxybutyrate dehydrogenase
MRFLGMFNAHLFPAHCSPRIFLVFLCVAAPYCAAKHGVAGFTKSTALEVATKGITVNAICPGYVWTELIENQLEASAKSRGMTPEQLIKDVLLRPQPIGRFVTVRS